MIDINGYISTSFKIFKVYFKENTYFNDSCIQYFIFMKCGWRSDTEWTAKYGAGFP